MKDLGFDTIHTKHLWIKVRLVADFANCRLMSYRNVSLSVSEAAEEP